MISYENDVHTARVEDKSFTVGTGIHIFYKGLKGQALKRPLMARYLCVISGKL